MLLIGTGQNILAQLGDIEGNSTSGNMSSLSKSTNAIESQAQELSFSYSEVAPYTSHVHVEKNGEHKNTSSSYSFASTTEDYIVVWLDSNIDKSNEIHQNVIMQLQQIVNSVNTFTDANECINFVTQSKYKIFLMIVSNDLGQQIVHLIQDIPQLESIYVFCNGRSDHESWIQQCKKVKGVFTQITYICDSINAKIRRYDNYLTTVNSLFLTDTPIRGLNELDQSFMYSQLLKEILLEMKHDDKKKEMKELVEFLRHQYNGDNYELRSINEFEQNYNWDSSIKWYTKKYFIYSTLNKALRTQDINIIIKMGFFIRDLHRQIEQLHSASVDSIPSTVYRGQALLTAEFEKLRNSKGGLLSFNNFLSTSADQAVSFAFAESNRHESNKTGILFEIEIDSSISYISFAVLDNVGQFGDEKEILFSMNTIFRIGDIEEIKDRLWNVKLILTNDNDEQLKRITDSLRKEIGEGTGWHRLGYLMIMLDEIDKAEKIYTRLLYQTSHDKWQNLAALNNQLGIISEKKGNYKNALSFFQNTRDIEEKFLPPNHLDLSTTYNNIAEIYHTMKDYSSAHDFHQKALIIGQKCRPSSDPLLAATYNNIARLYSSMGDYQNARLSAQNALEIAENSSLGSHPDLAHIYDTLASVYTLLGEYPESLIFYEKAFKVRQKALPPNHASLLTTQNNIASAFNSMGHYSKALPLYKEVLEFRQKSLHPNHPDLALFYRNIGLTYNNMGDQPNALGFCQKALEIQETSASCNKSDIATIYNNIGQVYENKREFETAISYYKKALDIDKEYLPSDHPDLAMTYENLGRVYQEMNDDLNALLSHQKALKIRRNCLAFNYPQLASSYTNIGRCYQNKEKYRTAISFYEKAQEIHEKSAIPNYPELAIVYNNIGTTYHLTKDYSSALSFFQKTLDIETESLGPDHPDLAYIHDNIAYALEGLRQYKEAFNHIKKALDIATRALDPNDTRLPIFQTHFSRLLSWVKI
ncbi:unnamed protein product [Didymodactylos carnosus]|uniref:ADP ribosyltransferase domain-containing protein n=1 Tax=Didymodactylos carnosus TaxID=1234261 RepID=A0A8S2HP71_9BILA|nr:unnamed protein product [Didymodactylos carnosus]CAF3645319.1 unnamed protein product [Didymodactylos carnosus]